MMKLTEVTINKYKSFLTEQSVHIEDKVTRIVGKNESGKTSFLEALTKYNYYDKNDKTFSFNKTNDYPRNELKTYEQQNPENNCAVVSCTFEISDALLGEIQDDVGKDTFKQKTISISHKYNGGKTYSIYSNTPAFIMNFLSMYDISQEKHDELTKTKTVKTLYEDLNADAELKAIAIALKTDFIDIAFTGFKDDVVGGYIAKKYIEPNIPQFWYFDEYYSLPSEVSLTNLQNKTTDSRVSKEQLDIVKALFSLANIDTTKLLADGDFEELKAELEATSNIITDKLLEYWSTNTNLEIRFEPRTINNEKMLNIRIWNTKHRASLPLERRSKGFNWFFSFLVWFSQIENKDNVIILLDEPGINLHADAQSDLLRYIDEKLAPKYQIIYTTHSPFMVDMTKFHEIRTVFDSGDAKVGSLISDALDEKDKATLFPLQAALGYNVAQHLFVSPKNLLVEGVSDLVYLTLVSEKLREIGKTSLSEDITIIPVGGLDKVATFISLLRGNKLQIACLLDTFTDQKGKRRITDLVQGKIIKESNVIFFDEFTAGINPAEIEDMFTANEYIELFNREFSEYDDIKAEDIVDGRSIVEQINKIVNTKRFNHYRPANNLSRNLAFLDKVSDASLDIFANAFEKVNRVLK
jgi:predicted ATP-dependent endonuclease of OLD family